LAGADALFVRALVLEDQGSPRDALAHYHALLAQAPNNADTSINRVPLLPRLGRWEEAERSHREYAARCPDSARPWNNLADVLLARGRYGEALEALDRIPQAKGEGSALVRRGIALSSLRRFDEARAAFALGIQRFPAEVVAFVDRVAPGAPLDLVLSPENLFIARQYISQGQYDWSNWDAYVAQMRRAADDPTIRVEPAAAFMALHVPLSGSERCALARGIAARIEASVPALPAPAARTRRRIRVGLLSPDFREHLNSHLLLPLFELADRSHFELYAYSLAPDDGSAIRAKVLAAADVFRDLQHLPDREAAAAIRNDDIDILLDVGGHTAGARFAIVAQRPARIQALYLGFPASLGSSRVDYVIVDPVVGSDSTEFVESLIHLPHSFFLYDFRRPVPDTAMSRAEYGLPEKAFVYCAFHKAEKISPDTFDLWLRIILRVPGSILWFRGLSDQASQNLRTRAAVNGVDPMRLVFAPFEPQYESRYLPRQRLGDLMIDALHHNALTNACDALSVGLPVLTLVGSAMAARGGESLVRAAGLPELVAPHCEGFVEMAVRLAKDRSLLASYRSRLKLRDGPLFDTSGRVREIEAAFDSMVRSLPAA